MDRWAKGTARTQIRRLGAGLRKNTRGSCRVSVATNKGLLQYGKNWKLVEQVVHTRTAAQVRSHAQKFFNRLDREQRKMKHVQEVEASPEEDSSE